MSTCPLFHFFSSTIPRPPTSTLFPYTTLFRSFNRLNPVTSNSYRPGGASRPSPRRPSHCNSRGPSLSPAYNGNIVERSEEHTSELQSHSDLVCRLLLEKKKKYRQNTEFCTRRS